MVLDTPGLFLHNIKHKEYYKEACITIGMEMLVTFKVHTTEYLFTYLTSKY